MRHYLDLHIHSRYSRATSPALNPTTLSHWAEIKGLGLIGTGDLTHPAWLKELEDHLSLRDDGFYSLKNQPQGPRFVPTGEISAIYKQDGRTRKIHLVVIAPDLPAATKFSKTLGAMGNVTSDGRPILGLSARHLLEIALTTHPEMIVVPAHIWTPWFSLFGAKSGFDHLEECFGDLSHHITALETGLSSDPAMNRLVSALDSRVLISSSDAHSPDKLGREATILSGPLTWSNLATALKGGPTLAGTVEFFPEEGKYHLDGHLGCGPGLTPEETRAAGGLCPTCGRPLTIGVMHRVAELADREAPPIDRLPDHHLVPLAELLGQIFDVGPKSKRVMETFTKIINEFGNELKLLLETPLVDIESQAGPLLRLAVERMRKGDIRAQGGFDGQYGVITAIGPEDRATLSGQGRLFETRPASTTKRTRQTITPLATKGKNQTTQAPSLANNDLLLDGLDEKQRQAVVSRSEVLAVLAGPGSGKTRVLVHRAAWLIRENLAQPHQVLLTTYTKKSASELAPRLAAALPCPELGDQVRITTLHGLAYDLLKNQFPEWELAPEDWLADLAAKTAAKTSLKTQALTTLISRLKNGSATLNLLEQETPGLAQALNYYNQTLAENRRWDFDDLIAQADPNQASLPFKSILVDEFQDFSPAQFDFLKRLLPPPDQMASGQPSLTVIGDPNQSIYAFRGASPRIFDRLASHFGGQTIELEANYRSTKTITQAGGALMGHGHRPSRPEVGPKIIRATLASAKQEAAYVVSRLSAHLGVINLGREGTHRQDDELMPGLALNDMAILFRLRSLSQNLIEALDQAGLAWQLCGQDPLTATDQLDFKADKINLLTMHAAKGLEFKLVFILGVEEGLCPYFTTTEGEAQDRLEEEERLFYVAATRAKDRLYLTRSEKRHLYGQTLPGVASRFWGKIPSELCQDLTPKPKKSPTVSPTLFDLKK